MRTAFDETIPGIHDGAPHVCRDGRELRTWGRERAGSRRAISSETRRSRRMTAHLRSTRRVGGKQKHMVLFIKTNGKPRLGRPRMILEELEQTAYEARSTDRRPWTTRKRNRARNRRARASRKANRP